MITDILLKIIITILNVLTAWLPAWTLPDFIYDLAVNFIEFGKYAFVFINGDALYDVFELMLETMIFLMMFKAVWTFISLIRGARLN